VGNYYDSGKDSKQLPDGGKMTHASRLDEWWDFQSIAGDDAPNDAKWTVFRAIVNQHIEEYTIPQYGDLPDDFASTWSQADCLRNIEKYLRRIRKNSREQQHGLDCIKRAHYACIAYFKGGDTEKQTMINHAISACEDYYTEYHA